MPGFNEVMRYAAVNHAVSGWRVRWRTVPAVAEVCRRQARHCHTRRVERSRAFALPHPGQRNPSGQRVSTRYRRQASSSGNRRWNSASVLG